MLNLFISIFVKYTIYLIIITHCIFEKNANAYEISTGFKPKIFEVVKYVRMLL